MKCRLLALSNKDALFNTALDQLLLENAAQGQFTLAFTKWNSSVLIGNSQSLALDVDFEACKDRGISVVRRFSGGQAVYLDENYIVFVVAGPRSFFPASLTELRRQLCLSCARALVKFGVPAAFFKPDNLVIVSPSVRTLGNSGQVIKRDAVLVQASLRYDLTDEGLRTMLAVLKTNGRSLRKFFEATKKTLAWIGEFTDAGIVEIENALHEEIMAAYKCSGHYYDNISQDENRKIREIGDSLIHDMRLEDKPTYQSRGVCYFYLDGKCILPEIADFLPYNKPSGTEESTI